MADTFKTSERYTSVAITLHWLLALLMVGTFVLGVYMHELPMSLAKLKLFNWHKWAGVVILGLSVLRLLWRVTHRPPADLPAPPLQQLAAHAVHGALYALFFAVPLVGWAYSSAAGYPIVLFGVLPLPDFVAVDKALSDNLKPLHGWLAWSMAVLVALHVAAALKHHVIDGDGLLNRMRPGRVA
ncbi:cytochrome B561 [Vitreoscilla filiformis]|uniref:Cytochrome B561 n=1 Tax=Vitreoscilla filiformis TaxID=63 RepID=A0A221KDM5_VITFI|nr:cytochrome b [Vitreoscilla filiformis]ASM77085.1 cytochrome B561 [Vitreoscilla filiformis]